MTREPIYTLEKENYTLRIFEPSKLSEDQFTVYIDKDKSPFNAFCRKDLEDAKQDGIRKIDYCIGLDREKLKKDLSIANEIANLTDQKNLAYSERNKLLAAYAKLLYACGINVGIGLHELKEGETWDADWMHIVFIDLPTGQVSFHIHDSELAYFQGLPQYQGVYDGHSTQEKWARVLNFNPEWGFWGG